ncbi:putative endonuclease [Pseudobutyrivibrio sp. OR37]|uniref:YraN family protein n=1 Tax=Pseudobutyrivibrio sp. OR37 TaxID=1798186 RepID=UPI0008E9543E|nr:YraN family protein [Pseudobutyrivibrio sp. OR37]SFH61801.1 putative endonuclease [Pseudobutyrivibrio sp. OR37]
MNSRKQGNDFEKLAANFLKTQGMTILKLNFYCKMGEVDIIAKDEEYLVFVEVKYRKSSAKGSGFEAVNFNKMRKISRVADYYMFSHHYSGDTNVRFDVVVIEEGHLKHLKNAFEYIPVC